MRKRYSLSILVPVFNEERTIEEVIDRITAISLPAWETEIVIIDDGSTDKTVEKIERHLRKVKQGSLIRHTLNQGKGAAVRSGIKKAKGAFLLIQDADLEYDPEDIPKLLQPIEAGEAEVVYGSRLQRLPNFRRDERTPRFLLHYIGNRLLSGLASLLYGQKLTDIETGYKVFPRKAVENLHLTARGFEFEPEITIQLIKAGYTVYEVPISTNPRDYAAGKKLRTIPDGIKALQMILRLK